MIPNFAQSLYERFDREAIPILLAGGWAVCHHGYSRFTRDVDWICSRSDEARALVLMETLGFEIVFESMATRFQLKNHPDFPPIDLLWVSSETFAKMADTDQRTGTHRDIPVINLESLLAMKIYALKDQDERQGRDLLDIRQLLAENKNAISDQLLRGLCEQFANPGAYNLIHHIS